MADLSVLDLVRLSAVANARITIESLGTGATGHVTFDHGLMGRPTFSGVCEEGRVPNYENTAASVLEDATWVTMESRGSTVEIAPDSFLLVAPRMLDVIDALPGTDMPDFGALPYGGVINAAPDGHKPNCKVSWQPVAGTAHCSTCKLLFIGEKPLR